MSTTNKASSMVFPQAKHFISKDHYQNYFDATIPPIITVSPGDLIHVETNDCFHGKITPDVPNPTQVLAGLPKNQRNPITGPIYVEGAMPGDVLAVKLLDIRPQGIGAACCRPQVGQLCHFISETTTKFFDLSNDGKMVTMRDVVVVQSNNNGKRPRPSCFSRMGPISFPSSPMLGVIGVAPAGKDPIMTIPAGKHGGNLDNNQNGIGSTVYIPVNHPGALLSMGDMHASQGDGEISGNGVEIGGHVLLQCDVIKEKDLYAALTETDDATTGSIGNMRIEYPVTETATHWISHGVVEENIPQSTTVACQEAAILLVRQWGFTPEEAFIFLSVKGDLGVCQSCHPYPGSSIAKMSVPKLAVCPRPFRTLLEEEDS